ncbi:ORF124 [Ostreid herpesvirus 1]|uniref:Uncharacterized protein ORF124 n=1 Tax=Ostreid herpesvirus 1 (isolate France) TaxID=654903 RepID=Y124_OSHVF|nr:ORF124 [Ostreid herpesvirus 1]Q6R7A2.1 RecName: Full=Uncharacterized protein ORF124 [Ostreid herpesvirus 1 (isolate France)]AAS01013.1 ORF124 [Ostreid herpesvirus 1]
MEVINTLFKLAGTNQEHAQSAQPEPMIEEYFTTGYTPAEPIVVEEYFTRGVSSETIYVKDEEYDPASNWVVPKREEPKSPGPMVWLNESSADNGPNYKRVDRVTGETSLVTRDREDVRKMSLMLMDKHQDMLRGELLNFQNNINKSGSCLMCRKVKCTTVKSPCCGLDFCNTCITVMGRRFHAKNFDINKPMESDLINNESPIKEVPECPFCGNDFFNEDCQFSKIFMRDLLERCENDCGMEQFYIAKLKKRCAKRTKRINKNKRLAKDLSKKISHKIFRRIESEAGKISPGARGKFVANKIRENKGKVDFSVMTQKYYHYSAVDMVRYGCGLSGLTQVLDAEPRLTNGSCKDHKDDGFGIIPVHKHAYTGNFEPAILKLAIEREEFDIFNAVDNELNTVVHDIMNMPHPNGSDKYLPFLEKNVNLFSSVMDQQNDRGYTPRTLAKFGIMSCDKCDGNTCERGRILKEKYNVTV